MSITILAMINPFVQSHLILPLQAHSWLEIQASFRLIPHWTRLKLDTLGQMIKIGVTF